MITAIMVNCGNTDNEIIIKQIKYGFSKNWLNCRRCQIYESSSVVNDKFELINWIKTSDKIFWDFLSLTPEKLTSADGDSGLC